MLIFGFWLIFLFSDAMLGGLTEMQSKEVVQELAEVP